MSAILLPPVDLESLDDTKPAGPYLREIDEQGLRLLCLAAIRQAVLDSRKNDELAIRAQIWLADVPRWWLRALGIQRAWGDERARQLIYGECRYRRLILDEGESDDEQLLPENR